MQLAGNALGSGPAAPSMHILTARGSARTAHTTTITFLASQLDRPASSARAACPTADHRRARLALSCGFPRSSLGQGLWPENAGVVVAGFEKARGMLVLPSPTLGGLWPTIGKISR